MDISGFSFLPNPLHKAWDMPSQEAYDRAWEMCEKCN
jgi:hypothetical protein